jgi:PAS domain S-box-containing protein
MVRMQDHIGAGRRPLPWWTWIAPGILCHLGTQISLATKLEAGISAIYLPIPIALVLSFWWGPRVLLGLYANAVLSAGLWDLPRWGLWPLYAMPETAAVFAGWWLFVRAGRGDCRLPNLDHTLRFVLLAVLPAALLNAFYVEGQLVLLHDSSAAGFWRDAWSGGIATLLDGLAIAAPAAMLLTPWMERRGLLAAPLPPLPDRARPVRGARETWEIVAVFAVLALLSRVMPLGRYWSVGGLFVLWAALRFGARLAVVANLWLEFLVMLLPAILLGTTHAAGMPPVELQNLQTVLALFCVASLLAGRTIDDQRDEIAQRKEAERALASSEERFRGAMENSPVGMALVGLDGRYLEVNPALCRIVGYTREEMLRSNAGELTHPDDRPRDLEIIRRMLAGALDTYQTEKRYMHRSGRAVWVELNASILRDPAGAPVHFISQMQDVTDRKALEDQLRQAQKMEAVGQLAGGIAHDFNNLLTVINGHTDLMLRHQPEAKIRHELEQVRHAGERAASLTGQLLAFSRRAVVEPRVLNLNRIVRDTERLLRRMIGEDVRLDTALDPAIGPLRADAGQVGQVLMNLAVNARDAMPRGGTLTVATSCAVRPSGAADGAGPPLRWVQLAVTDSGTGMTPEVRRRIFEPFFTTKGPTRGTGLGLATVFGIVQQGGGFIEVDSEPGRGSTFRMFWPECAGEAIASVAPPELAAPRAGGGTVLLVEDEAAVRQLIVQVLEAQGYTLLIAENGTEALRVAQAHRGHITMLLTDVVMPEMSGRDLAESLRPRMPELKVLYMSGYTSDDVLRHGVFGGEADFLQKPFSVSALTHKVAEVLGR